MTPKSPVVDGGVDPLPTAPHDLGMSASRAAAPLVREGAPEINTTQTFRYHAGERPGN